MSDKLSKCLNLLRHKSSDAIVSRQVITIIKSLEYDITYAKDFLQCDDNYIYKIWSNVKKSDRWNWREIQNIIEENIDTSQLTEYNNLVDQYFYSEEKLLSEGEQGISKLFSNIMRDKLIISNSKGDGYFYSEDTKSYEKQDKCILVDLIPKVLIPVIDNIMNKLKEETYIDDDDSYKRRKELNNIKTSNS
jgi:hypothetical protein